MKTKIYLLGLISLLYFTWVSALTFSTQDQLTFRPDEWIKEILPITINTTLDTEISSKNGFSLIIPIDANLRFYPNQELSLTWTAANKIKSYKVPANMTNLIFNVSSDFKSNDTLVISWIKIIVYNKESGYKYIEINTNGDLTSVNTQLDYGIRINNLYWLHSNIGPMEVFNLTGSLVWDNLKLKWEVPWDVNFQAFEIYYQDNSWAIIDKTFVNTLDNYSYIVWENVKKLTIKSVDTSAKYSSWLTFDLDYFKSTSINNNTWTSTWTVWIIQTQTGIIIPIQTQQIKYIPTFSRYKDTLDRLINAMDRYISSNQKPLLSINAQNNIIIIRNDIAKVAEDIDKADMDSRSLYIIRLKLKVLNLKEELFK